ncbi:hypothetical protein C8Q80DRAFT_1202223 [Daedaleopsis nitida]|nr:hypothetical protein C8Q80DRAFT_1202223 [Daedaleopsis nitida]
MTRLPLIGTLLTTMIDDPEDIQDSTHCRSRYESVHHQGSVGNSSSHDKCIAFGAQQVRLFLMAGSE